MCAPPPTQAPSDSDEDSSDDDDMMPLADPSSDDEDHEDVFETVYLDVHVQFTIVEDLWVVIGLTLK